MKNQSFQNNSGKTQLIRTKFRTYAQVKGQKRSGNCAIGQVGTKWGVQTSTAQPGFVRNMR